MSALSDWCGRYDEDGDGSDHDHLERLYAALAALEAESSKAAAKRALATISKQGRDA